uniref:BRCT domain-containing protein n=1 Tax=Branchiostoma floridae TaxID=7739 RepID=C3Z1H4_BRAFL|eukprot:XP_002597580.1 hypothetical protein BRAFLDRAFT_82314 [Branchiostoma floridae]
MAEEFVVQFVLDEDEDDQSQMQRAEEAVRTTANLPTQVINGPAALEITKAQKNALVVCDPFEGEVYEHLKALKCRIVGPQCVLSCLKLGKAIPKADHPIYTVAMKDVVISCSSVEKQERAMIHELVHLMGGRVAKDFTAMVTHLVAGEVGSKKYHVAVKLGKPIMLPEWIRACWERGKTRHINATDEEFDQYKCRLFQGCVVCVSGLDSVDRQEIRSQVEQHGGRYSGELRMKECTHLVAKEPKGAKYEFARKWKLHCVTTRWFYDSLEAGACQDENLYRLDKTKSTGNNKTSTPSQERKAPRFSTNSIADISTISTASSRGNMSHVNETNLDGTRLPLDASRDYGETLHYELDNLDISNIGADTFLDGFTIYLSGFTGTRLEKLRRIVNAGGGMRLNQLNEKVSHVVMSGPDEHLAQKLTAENLRPHVVSAMWLVECVKEGRQVSEETFYCLELPPLDPTSPVQPKIVKKSVPDQPPPPQPEDEDATQMEEEEPADDDIMSQYLAEAEEDEEDTTTIEVPQERQEPTEEEDDEVVLMMPQEKNKPEEQEEDEEVVLMMPQEKNQPEEQEEEDGDVTMAMDEDEAEMETGGGGVFEGKLFSFYSFTEGQTATLADFVGQNGGSVVKSGSRSVPNYAVVPLLGFPEGISAEEIVTDCWLNMCLEQETLLRPEHNPLFTPLTFKPDAMPLVGCVLSLSQYTGVEREFLTGLAEELGACCQEFFVRKAQPSKNLQASTHLICKTPEGSKYQAAKKWKLPAVTSHWIFECGRSGKKIPEERFLVSNVPQQQEPQEPKADKPAKTSNAPNHESKPKEARLSVTPSEAPGPSKDSPGNKENRQEDRRTSTLPKQQTSLPSTSTKEEIISPIKKEDRTCNTNTTAQKVSEPPRSKEQNDRKETSKPSVIPKNKMPVLNKEPLAAKNKTPVLSKEQLSVKKNKRLTELQKTQVKLDTPSKFLSKGVVFKPSFDMQDAMDALQSPTVVGSQGQRKRARRSSVPLDALLQQNLEKALSNFSKEGNQPALGMPQGGQEEEEDEEEEEVFTKEPSPPRPLSGVVIYVSKKLSKQQSDYNDLANSLGADYRWTYDESVTHFIFQGRANDTTKEFRRRREQGKTIAVSPLAAAVRGAGERLDETLFPHTYNPKLSLVRIYLTLFPHTYNPKLSLVRIYLTLFPHTYNPKLSLVRIYLTLFPHTYNPKLSLVRIYLTLFPHTYNPKLSLVRIYLTLFPHTYNPKLSLVRIYLTLFPHTYNPKLSLVRIYLTLFPHTYNPKLSLVRIYLTLFPHTYNPKLSLVRIYLTLFPHTYNPKLSLVRIYLTLFPHTYNPKLSLVRIYLTLFPHTYNPKLSLSQAVVSKTPARSTRSSSRRKDSEQQDKQDSTEGEEEREQEDQGQDRTHIEQEGGTLEMREDFQRQFEEIMSATRVTRSSRRRTKRLNDSTGTPSASDDSAKRFSTRSRTRAPSQTSKGDGKDKLAGQEQTKSAAKCPENFTEASQSIQISWDDPTGRLERERIAEQLRYRASPTQELEELSQDGQDFLTRMSGETANQDQGPGQLRHPSANNRAASTSPNQGADRSFGEDEPTPTPEGPSIAFPIARPAVPHPPTVARAQGEEEEEVQKQVYVFQMSGMTPQEKMDYSGLIEELGGEVVDKQTFDGRCTHIVVGNPNRNEKYLSALATGRWILHRSYMEACREAKAFVETKSAAKCPENFTEASQSIQISWDDPTGRLERERIAEQLRYRASPTQVDV